MELRKRLAASFGVSVTFVGLLVGGAIAPAQADVQLHTCTNHLMGDGSTLRECFIQEDVPGGSINAAISWMYATYYADGDLKDPGYGDPITYRLTDDPSDNACTFGRIVVADYPVVDATEVTVCNGANRQVSYYVNRGDSTGGVTRVGKVKLQTKMRSTGTWQTVWAFDVTTPAP